MEFKARSRAKATQEMECPKILAIQSNPGSLDPTVTYGPETLESATARTEKLKPSIYPADGKWYQRSTSRSFTLPALATAQLDHQSIATHIRTLVDTPIPARAQQLALNNLGPLPNDDGHWGPDVAERQLHDELSNKEREPSFAVAADDLFADEIQHFSGNGGYLNTYYNKGELIKAEILVNYCLSGL